MYGSTVINWGERIPPAYRGNDHIREFYNAFYHGHTKRSVPPPGFQGSFGVVVVLGGDSFHLLKQSNIENAILPPPGPGLHPFEPAKLPPLVEDDWLVNGITDKTAPASRIFNQTPSGEQSLPPNGPDKGTVFVTSPKHINSSYQCGSGPFHGVTYVRIKIPCVSSQPKILLPTQKWGVSKCPKTWAGS